MSFLLRWSNKLGGPKLMGLLLGGGPVGNAALHEQESSDSPRQRVNSHK